MIALLWAALVAVALIAAAAFGLVLVLARRLRAVVERVDLFLPVSDGRLPDPGTPVPEFATVAVDGTPVSHLDLAEADRIIAFLTTDCGSCRDQVPGLQGLDAQAWPRPIVVVIGQPSERPELVAPLAEHAIVVEEEYDGAIVRAFDIHEFPAMVLAGAGTIRTAAHGLARVLESARQPAAT